MKMTHSTVLVAMSLLDDPNGRHWGYALSQASGVRSGVMYPILTRMLDEGWLEDGWEDESVTAVEGRPPRRYYVLTDEGKTGLGAMLRRAESEKRFRPVLGGALGWTN